MLPERTLSSRTSQTESSVEEATLITLELYEQLLKLQVMLADEREVQPPMAAAILERYAQLSRIDAVLNAEQRDRVGAHHRILVQPMFFSVPLIRRSVDRPLGYPGDYRMVEMIFGATERVDGALGQWLNDLVLQAAPSRAHRYRAPWTCGWLDRLAREQAEPLRILSFACGPELVLRSYLKPEMSAEIVLCDHEPLALKEAASGLTPLLGPSSTLRYVELSAISLLRGNGAQALRPESEPRPFDALLVLGLFDYLSAGLIRRLMPAFAAMLRPNGLILTSNLSTENPHRSLMEYVADWRVLHRTPAEFSALMLHDAAFSLDELCSDPNAANLLFAGRAQVQHESERD